MHVLLYRISLMSNKSFTSYLKSSVFLLSMFSFGIVVANTVDQAPSTQHVQKSRKAKIPPRNTVVKKPSTYNGNHMFSTTQSNNGLDENSSPITVGMYIKAHSAKALNLSNFNISGPKSTWISIAQDKATIKYHNGSKFVTGIKGTGSDIKNTSNIFTNAFVSGGLNAGIELPMYDGGTVAISGNIGMCSSQSHSALYEILYPKGSVRYYVSNNAPGKERNLEMYNTDDVRYISLVKTDSKPSIEIGIGTSFKQLVAQREQMSTYVTAGIYANAEIAKKGNITSTISGSGIAGATLFSDVAQNSAMALDMIMNSKTKVFTGTIDKMLITGEVGATLGAGIDMSNGTSVSLVLNGGYAFSSKSPIIYSLDTDLKDPISNANGKSLSTYLQDSVGMTPASVKSDSGNGDILFAGKNAIKADAACGTLVLGIKAGINIKLN